MKMMTTQRLREAIQVLILRLPTARTRQEHKLYLAGLVDCLYDVGRITEIQRQTMYRKALGWMRTPSKRKRST